MLGGLALIGVIGSAWSVWFGFLAVIAQVGPIGLGIRGVSSPLAWTSRLRRLAGLAAILAGSAYVVGGLLDLPVVVAIGLVGLPLLVDLSLLILSPVESALGGKWVERAARKLEAVGSEVVAITGSYGKTTTKNYTAHLLTGSRRVIASPASFNNRMGLARAINENLSPGTQVFVAEMGTYGKGEIAELCEWIPPKVAAMVAIGPVHLERFKSEERIVEAKSEILDDAEAGVICVDHPLLADLARRRSSEMRIIEVSTGDRGTVRVVEGGVFVDGGRVADTPGEAFAANLAVALGICLALDVGIDEVAPRIGDLPMSEHRQTVQYGEGGFSIIDDTFNSNPAGARRGLEVLAMVGAAGKKAVVTPGMVELGSRQRDENADFAAAASEVAEHLVIVGATNREALVRGSENGQATVTVVESREAAVSWVRENLGPGDAVLYENDLPDHYP
jgi:UDP-N-acetylmuramoyl-tripeptide--D-alanyl-D-alanine ligase